MYMFFVFDSDWGNKYTYMHVHVAFDLGLGIYITRPVFYIYRYFIYIN